MPIKLKTPIGRTTKVPVQNRLASKLTKKTKKEIGTKTVSISESQICKKCLVVSRVKLASIVREIAP